MDGKKSENDCFMYNMGILVGCPCEVTIRDGRKYDGIFSAFAVDRHELLIEAAHLITDETTEESPITESYDVLVVPTDKVIKNNSFYVLYNKNILLIPFCGGFKQMLSVRFKSVDTSYATRDFATDTAITASRNNSIRDKELTPWDGPDGSDEDLSLEVDLSATARVCQIELFNLRVYFIYSFLFVFIFRRLMAGKQRTCLRKMKRNMVSHHHTVKICLDTRRKLINLTWIH
jgi:hypothetical protein